MLERYRLEVDYCTEAEVAEVISKYLGKEISENGKEISGHVIIGYRVDSRGSLLISISDPHSCRIYDIHPSYIPKLLEDITKLQSERRRREATQILISEVGSEGPMNYEDVAIKAVETIKKLKAKAKELEEKLS